MLKKSPLFLYAKSYSFSMRIGSLTLCTSYKSLGSYSSTDELNCDFTIESVLPLALVDIVLNPLLLSIIYRIKEN